MKSHLCLRGPVIAFVFVTAAGLIAPRATTPAPAKLPLLTHAPIAAHHDEKGNLKRSISNGIETGNWSGYALANFKTGSLYTAAQATWRVPRVSYAVPPPVCHAVQLGSHSFPVCRPPIPLPQAEYSASWVGIGGYCEDANCTVGDNTLIQLGTTQAVSRSGQTQYYAWMEMLPNGPIIISSSDPNCESLSCANPVRPGDIIHASLWCTSDCSTPFSANQMWTLQMVNETQNWTFSTTVPYASSLLSAVWILEAPVSSAGILPLANYRSEGFASTNVCTPSSPSTCAPTTTPSSSPRFTDPGVANSNSDWIVMVDPYGETSVPTIPGSDPFYTCWGNNPYSLVPCVPGPQIAESP